jgi:hypothetical protein
LVLAASVQLLASPALTDARAPAGRDSVIRIHTVPRLAGMKFTLDGRSAVTGRQGWADLPVPPSAMFVTKFGQRRLRASALPRMTDTRHRPYEVARLSRYYGGGRTAALTRIFKVKPRFVDLSGAPVDPALVQSVVLKSITGVQYRSSGHEPLVLPGTRVAPFTGKLLSKNLQYSVEKVLVDGANVVNRAQQRFEPRSVRRITVKLLFFRAKFTSRDAIFGFHIGSNIVLRYPSGAVHRYNLGPDGTVVLPALPRGNYSVKVHGPGFSFSRPVSVSRRQVVDLKVISYLDLGVIVAAAAVVLAALLVVRRRRRLHAAVPLPEPPPEPLVLEQAEVPVADGPLTPGQEAHVAKAICGNHPDDLGLPEPLWTPELVAELIDLRLAVDLEVEAISPYLREWGVMVEDAPPPAFANGDERILWLTTSDARTRYGRRRAIGTVAGDGELSFLVFKSRLKAALIIDFLGRLMWQNAGRKIIVIVDAEQVHRSKKVRAWAAERQAIELYLPPELPEAEAEEAVEPDAHTERHVTHA